MKKIMLLLVLCWLLLPGIIVQAEESDRISLPDWEISVRPKPSMAEIEQERWSYVFTNDIGIYVFDHQSLNVDETDKTQVNVLTKTIFTDPKVIDKLNEVYKEKLNEGDEVACSEMQMVFQLKRKMYAVTETRVFSARGVVLEDRKQLVRFTSVQPKTFADSMYNIAQDYKRSN